MSHRELIDKVLDMYDIHIDFFDVLYMWNKPHRHFHTTENHLFPILDDIISFTEKYNCSEDTFYKLVMCAIFHDIIYDPKSFTNEEDSVMFLHSHFKDDNFNVLNDISEVILETKEHKSTTKLSEMFCEFDLKVLESDFASLLRYEDQIFKEYEFVNWKIYQEKRIEILESLKYETTNVQNIDCLIEHIRHRKPNIAVFAASFNPFTIGHNNILQKAEKMYDKVIITKGKNDSKDIDEKQFESEFQSLKNLFPNKEVVTYKGLLSNFLKKEGDITLIRGIRNATDLDAENTFTFYIKGLYPELKIVYIPCDPEFQYISSTGVRTLKKYGDDWKKYVPNDQSVME